MDNNDDLHPAINTVRNFLNDKQIPYKLRVFDAPAHSASQAAALLKCPLGAIVKSLVFEKSTSSDLLLALVSGQNRADLQRLSNLADAPVRVAAPEKVLTRTGYPVGAVPPCGLPGVSLTFIDADLMDFKRVWASAGAENILVEFNSADLVKLSAGKVAIIKQT